MKFKLLVLSTVLATMTACAGNPASPQAKQCESGLAAAYKELDFAKAKGLDGTWQYTKASTLLTGAKIQYEFGKYPNCIDKVQRARAFIKQSQQPVK